MEWQRKDKQAEDGWVKRFALTPKNCDIIEFVGTKPRERYDRTVWMESYMYMEHSFYSRGKTRRWWMCITRMTYLSLTNEQRVQWAQAMRKLVEEKQEAQ